MKKFIGINAGTNRVTVIMVMILSILFITGCLARRFTSRELDDLAKQFNPPADKSYIYVMRPTGFGSTSIHTSVALDGKFAAFIQPKTYILLEVLPKKHKIMMGEKRMSPPPGVEPNLFAKPITIDLETLPGRTYFCIWKSNVVKGAERKTIPSAVGRKLIIEDKYKRVVSKFDK